MQQKKLFLIILTVFLFLGCNPPLSLPSKVKNEYFTGGKIRSQLIMDDNSGQNGLLKKYGYNGNLTSTVRIHNGVKDGIETGYDSQGRVIWKLHYINGKQEGQQYAYYPNGDIMVSYTYVAGIKHGVAMSFNKDGSINKKVIYQYGKISN